MTSFSKDLYQHLHGDKDTFGMAFASAKKVEEYVQVAVPPGAKWREMYVGNYQVGGAGRGRAGRGRAG
jgi:hypothetical protein